MEISLETISWIAAAISIVVTYTALVQRYTNLERDVKDLKHWQEQVDPSKERHKRRDSDVIKFVKRDPPSQGA